MTSEIEKEIERLEKEAFEHCFISGKMCDYHFGKLSNFKKGVEMARKEFLDIFIERLYDKVIQYYLKTQKGIMPYQIEDWIKELKQNLGHSEGKGK